MRKLICFLICFAALNLLKFNCPAQEEPWLEQKSEHFSIYYKSVLDLEYVKKTLDAAEKYYIKIPEKIGFRNFSSWSWDRRCKIYFYPSQEEYRSISKRPAWSAGSVNFAERTIRAYFNQEDFIDKVLPHELGHLILREIVGYYTFIPGWLDEGLACFQEEQNQDKYLDEVKKLISEGYFLSLDRLNRINPDMLVVPTIFYSESDTLIKFLLSAYNPDKFKSWLEAIRSKKNWQSSLLDTYSFDNLDEMNDRWKEFLLK